MERSKEVEDKVLSSVEKENIFTGGGICSLCAYHEEDNLRLLTLEETHSFHKLIEDEEECRYFCESCFKMVIQMIKLSKEVETLHSRLTQSVTRVKSVLKIKRLPPSSSLDSVAPDYLFEVEIVPDEEIHKVVPPPSPPPTDESLEEQVDQIIPESDEQEDKQNEIIKSAFYCYVCKEQFKKDNSVRHFQTLKHMEAVGEKKKSFEIPKKYYCKPCEKQYDNMNRYRYERHIKTITHMKKSGEVVEKEHAKKSITKNNTTPITNKKRKNKAKDAEIDKVTLAEQKSDTDNEKPEDFNVTEALEENETDLDVKRKRRNSNTEKSEVKISEEISEPPDNALKCTCGISFNTKKDLQKHKQESRCAVSCDLCKKGFKKSANLTLHLKTKLHQFNLTCPEDRRICTPFSWTSSKEYKHELKTLRNKNLIHCGICDKKYSKRMYPKHLLSREHNLKLPEDQRGNLPKFVCETCGKNVSTQISLKHHITNMHLGQKPFVCDQCGKAYSLKTQLKHHMERHTGKPQCASCGLFMISSAILAAHMKQIHTERALLKCPHCEMNLVNKMSLNRHIERRHKTLKERCFCAPCNENFPTLFLRKEHDMKTHNKRAVHKCPKCPEIFLQDKTSFDIHMRRHNGEKPFVCGKCGKAFVKKWSLKVHNKAVCGGGDDSEEAKKIKERWRERNRKFRAKKTYKCDKCEVSFGQRQQFNHHMKKRHKIVRINK